ncbi:MAG: trimethylamine methyltransferase family protein [Alphaproteobacteria bacterium]|nr:trimethylamine methyltransferase family protein [Alphaproteobacteria bacterium]
MLQGTISINMVYHGAGWLKGGLGKFIIDCELLQNIMHYLKPVQPPRTTS